MHADYCREVEFETGDSTHFQALDKILPKRKYLTFYELKGDSSQTVKFDSEWGAILKMSEEYVMNTKEHADYSDFVREVLK